MEEISDEEISTNFHGEFRLLHSKYAFQLDHLTEKEKELHMLHLKTTEEHCYLTEEGFFSLSVGDVFNNFTDVHSVDEIRILTWEWTCPITSSIHKLVDICSWPGDNQSGIISFDDAPFLENGDGDLSVCLEHKWTEEQERFMGNYEDYNLSRLNFFECLRNNFNLDDPSPNYEIEDDFYAFVESISGQEAIKIDNEASELFSSKMRLVVEHKQNLADMHYHEFKYLKSSHKMEKQKIPGKLFSGDHFVCYWQKDPVSPKYFFVTRYNITFLVNENKKAIRKLYQGNCVLDQNDELASRIHAYVRLMKEHDYFVQLY